VKLNTVYSRLRLAREEFHCSGPHGIAQADRLEECE